MPQSAVALPASPTRLGCFIALEGIDGSGKGTQLALLAAALRQRGLVVHETAQPSSGPIGVMLRQILRGASSPSDRPDAATLALLFAADRLDHVRREIAPALREGTIVLCDRYDGSSIAYQSAMCGDEADAQLPWLAGVNDRALRPHLTVLLDLEAELAAERRERRGAPAELLESTALQRRVREQYHKLAQVRPSDTIAVVDASRVPELVHRDVLSLVVARLEQLRHSAP